MRCSKFVLFVFLSFLSFPTFSQVVLRHSINSGILPNDSDKIGVPKINQDTTEEFLSCGFDINDTVADFTLFDTLGKPTKLSTVLSDGKPVLLIMVSLSCPVSRHGMQKILPNIIEQYGKQINIFLIYSIEAHPIAPDVCPYADSVWVTKDNYQENILIRQEQNYYQRKQKCEAFQALFNFGVPVLIDGPGNEFWSTFGPAPNNAYLIAPNGMVYGKYGWFTHSKAELENDIPQLLQLKGSVQPRVKSSASIYKNPKTGKSSLVVKNENSYSFSISDLRGKAVVPETNSTKSTADLEKYQLGPGTYVVIVKTVSGRAFTLRYIVK